MRKKYNVLLTNDDGFNSDGIRKVYEVLNKRYNVVVVAPESEKSGVGHSFTYKEPIFFKKISESYAEEIYSVRGSPADCVKFAVSYLLPTKPDLIISGLNMGENSGISSHYSGTVAAAREGAFWKIRSFAFSICEETKKHINFYCDLIPYIVDELLLSESFLLNKCFFNINFPSCSPELLKGIKITKQSLAFFDDKYSKVLIDEEKEQKEGYLLYGKKVGIEEEEEYDSRALVNNWISVTPLTCDSTGYDEIPSLRNLENRFNLRGIKNER